MYRRATATAGRAGPRRGPFHAIIVTAAPPKIPTALIAQLDEGGIIVLPVGNDQQVLKCLRRQGGDIVEEIIEPVRFVPLVQGDLA